MNHRFPVSSIAGPLVLATLCLLTLGCSNNDLHEEMLALDFWGFDQDPVGGWRPYADRDEFETAADLIDHGVTKFALIMHAAKVPGQLGIEDIHKTR